MPWKFGLLLWSVLTAVTVIYSIVGLEKLFGRKLGVLRKSFKYWMNHLGGFIANTVCPVKEVELNKPPTTKEPIIISNHVCWFEIYYLVTKWWPISFLAKEEISRSTFIGTIATFGESLYVVR